MWQQTGDRPQRAKVEAPYLMSVRGSSQCGTPAEMPIGGRRERRKGGGDMGRSGVVHGVCTEDRLDKKSRRAPASGRWSE